LAEFAKNYNGTILYGSQAQLLLTAGSCEEAVSYGVKGPVLVNPGMMARGQTAMI